MAKKEPALLGLLFEEAFPSSGEQAFDSAAHANLKRLVVLGKALYGTTSKIWDQDARSKDPGADPVKFPKITEEQRLESEYFNDVSTRITSAISRTMRLRPKEVPINLSGVYITHADWRGMVLSGVNVSKTLIFATDLDDADLTGITQFAGAQFQCTAWWRAKTIGRGLYDYLQSHEKFKADTPYGSSNSVLPAGDYERGVKRIRIVPD